MMISWKGLVKCSSEGSINLTNDNINHQMDHLNIFNRGGSSMNSSTTFSCCFQGYLCGFKVTIKIKTNEVWCSNSNKNNKITSKYCEKRNLLLMCVYLTIQFFNLDYNFSTMANLLNIVRKKN